MLARGDEASVGAPRRRVGEGEALLGDLARAGAVRVHHPDIVAAAAIGGEGDLPPVGRKGRLMVEGQAGGEPPRGPAADPHDVDVAQHVEGDGAAVGTDVQVHPRALGRVDPDFAGLLAGRGIDVPRRRLRRRSAPAAASLRLGQGGGGEQGGGEEGDLFQHGLDLLRGAARPLDCRGAGARYATPRQAGRAVR